MVQSLRQKHNCQIQVEAWTLPLPNILSLGSAKLLSLLHDCMQQIINHALTLDQIA